jgi:predicted Zn finger-like uncharacterized protein
MPLAIQCPSCSKRYEVADSFRDKRVRCKQCGQTFTAASPAMAAPAANHAGDDWLGAELSQLSSPAAAAPQPIQQTATTSVSNPSGGPTDAQMRLVCCGMLALGLVVLVATAAMQAVQGVVSLTILMLTPLMFVLGIAGLISPNVVRACGKYGGHLPPRYKAIGWGLMGLSFVLMMLILVGLFAAGFRPDRPGARSNKPGLSRSQTTAVLERIRTSLESSPNPGATVRINSDRKKISFQYLT